MKGFGTERESVKPQRLCCSKESLGSFSMSQQEQEEEQDVAIDKEHGKIT